MRKHFWLWVNVALVQLIIVALLWFPQPLKIPTRAELSDAWQSVLTYIDQRWLNPEYYRQKELAEQQAAQEKIASLPPALIKQAEQKGSIKHILCPQNARAAKLHGLVPMLLDINAEGKVEKAMILEPSASPQIDQLVLQSAQKEIVFHPALDANNQPARDQRVISWPFDCRK